MPCAAAWKGEGGGRIHNSLYRKIPLYNNMLVSWHEILSRHFLFIKMLFIILCKQKRDELEDLPMSLSTRKIDIFVMRCTNLSSQPQVVLDDLGILATFISKTNSLILQRQLCAVRDVLCIKQFSF